ncbi:MAG: hypothetical protein U1E97_07415 [Alphaproteobacteria bacterium]
MRIVLDYILPLALPTILYVIWRLIQRKRAMTSGAADVPDLADAPWIWLFVAGVAVLGATLTVFALTTGEPIGGHYEPPQLIDGEVRPGRVVR